MRLSKCLVSIILALLILSLSLPGPVAAQVNEVRPTALNNKPGVKEKKFSRFESAGQDDPIQDAVTEAEYIVTGTITEKTYAIEENGTAYYRGAFTYTIFTLSVESVIKGEPEKDELLIRVEGSDLPENPGPLFLDYYFSISEKVLVCLQRIDDQYYQILTKGLLWHQGGEIYTSAPVDDIVGRIIVIMKSKEMPVVLPADKIPPLPTGRVEIPDGIKVNTTESSKQIDFSKSAGWNSLFTEDFEEAFPGGDWTVSGDPTWGEDDYKQHQGSYSAWCARGGTLGVDPDESPEYLNDMDCWMICGPFDLSNINISAAQIKFWLWNRSENNSDYFSWLVSSNGEDFFGFATSGGPDEPEWVEQTFDLSNVPVGNGNYESYLGQGEVWLAFCFSSDSSICDTGAFIDDIDLRVYINGPEIYSINPSSGPAGANIVMSISGYHFGQEQGNGKVSFFYKIEDNKEKRSDAKILAWSNSKITVIVPAHVSNGPLYVTPEGDVGEAEIDFGVTFSNAGAKWPTIDPSGVHFKINPHTADGTNDSDVLDAVLAAAETWNDVDGSFFEFDINDFEIDYTIDDVTENGESEIVWGALDPKYVAIVYIYDDNIFEADMKFNDDCHEFMCGEPNDNQYDIQSIATHEFGHFLCLNDLYGAADADKTMYGICSHTIDYASLESEDGIRYIYHGDRCLEEATDTSSLALCSSGYDSWQSQTSITHDGIDAAKSGQIINYQSSWIETAMYGEGTISFWWKVSSEATYDRLKFFVDDDPDDADDWEYKISGDQNWQQISHAITGTYTHELKWEYSKDGSTSTGSDCGWIDNIVITRSVSITSRDEDTEDSPVYYDVEFSYPVEGLDSDDVELDGTAGATTIEVCAIQGEAEKYVIKVSGMTSSGTIEVYIPEQVTQDASGNSNSASNIEVVNYEIPSTHPITPSTSEHGTITPATVTAIGHGSNQTFTITPDSGYMVSDVFIDDVSIGPVTVYTFTNVVAQHEIRATFKIDPSWSSPSSYNSGGTFTNPSRAYSSSNTYASADAAGEFEIYKNFNIPIIPAGSTIYGIEVKIEGYRGGATSQSFNVALSWDNSNYTSLKNTGDMDTVQDNVVILGSNIDTWGRTWSAGDFTNTNFRIKLIAADSPTSGIYLDVVQVRVFSAWNNPSNNSITTGGDNNGFQTNPTYAYLNDSSRAVNSNGAADRHIYYNYGINIPPGNDVSGIETRLDWYLDSTSGTSNMSVELSWDGGVNWTDAKTDTTETTSDGNPTGIVGGTTDLWGHSWTIDELSNSNFRVRLTCNSTSSARDFYLDWVPVRVTYVPSTYSVSAMVSGGHGTISPESQVLYYGDSAVIEITPDTGYHISGITDNGSPVAIADPFVLPNVHEDHGVVVTFEMNHDTGTTITTNFNPATDTLLVSFTATVSGGDSPTGSVNFIDDNTTIATVQISASGHAICSTTALPPGDHIIVAEYSGDNSNFGSTSTSLIQTVEEIGTDTPGNANQDEYINKNDATKVLRIYLGLDNATPGADANQNGVINLQDAVVIQLMYLGLYPTPPEEADLKRARSDSGNTISFSALSEAYYGDDYSLDINISDVNSLSTDGFIVAFDPDILELENITGGTIDQSVMSVNIIEGEKPGTYLVIQNSSNNQGISGSGTLATLHLKVVGKAGQTATITFLDGILLDNKVQEIDSDWGESTFSLQILDSDDVEESEKN